MRRGFHQSGYPVPVFTSLEGCQTSAKQSQFKSPHEIFKFLPIQNVKEIWAGPFWASKVISGRAQFPGELWNRSFYDALSVDVALILTASPDSRCLRPLESREARNLTLKSSPIEPEG